MTEVIEAKVTDQAPTTEPAETEFTSTTARFALLDAFSTEFAKWVKQQKPEVLAMLLEERKRTRSKSFEILAASDDPEDETVAATMSITQPSDKVEVSDKQALFEWVLRVFPSEIQTESFIRPAFLDQLTDKYVQAGEGGGVYLKDISIAPRNAVGTEVPGLRHVPAGKPTTFSTRWKPGQKEKALKALLEQVAPILGITTGPAEAGDDQDES